MRHYSLITAVAASIFIPAAGFSQGLYITNYQVVGQLPGSGTQSIITYRADVVNPGVPLPSLTATVTTLNPFSARPVPGQSTLTFPFIPRNGQVTSANTFTLTVDNAQPFSFSNLQWTFVIPPGPLANPGPNQTVSVGTQVKLDASGSTDATSTARLTYNWVFTSRPSGSRAMVMGSQSVNPTFTADVEGNFVIMLTVSDGTATNSASVTISTVNSPPVANAGPNQTVPAGSTVTLNGAGSTDVDGDLLSYQWSLASVPAGSAATLSGATTVSPTFTVDKKGSYVAQLIVSDGHGHSSSATVTITTLNTPPVANAGASQVVSSGTLVHLDGSGSTDADGDPLTYQWSLISLPAGSLAALSSPTAVNPTFTPDAGGTYIAQLIVNDGHVNSTPATVSITTTVTLPPVANAGPNQTVLHGTTVQLSGSGTDPQNYPLTFLWSLISKPSGSAATLLNATSINATFTADLPGSYVVQLIANNGFANSTPATVTITTTNTPPVANAGPAQNVTVGDVVTLDGSASSDADNDPITYSWSLLSRAAGSTAVLVPFDSVSPKFVADAPGTYVAQLIVNDGVSNSNPSTVTITAGAPPVLAITFAPNILGLAANASGTLNLTLSTPAGSGGQSVNLVSTNAGVATVPLTVTVPQGMTAVNVPVTSTGQGTTTVTAAASGFTPGTATVTVANVQIALGPSPLNLSNGVAGTLVVTLSSPAGSGGQVVSLVSSNPSVAAVPATVTVPEGLTRANVNVTPAATGGATITASAGTFFTPGTSTVTVSNVPQILLPANVIAPPGQTVPFSVTLSSPAPPTGTIITLVSSDTTKLTIIPANFMIQPGTTAPSFTPKLTGITYGTVTITATAYGLTTAVQQVRVTATLSFFYPTMSIAGTSKQYATLVLSAPAPAGGVIINLHSDNTSVATVPASVTIAAGATSQVVLVSGVAAGSTVIHASSLPNLADATLTVTDH